MVENVTYNDDVMYIINTYMHFQVIRITCIEFPFEGNRVVVDTKYLAILHLIHINGFSIITCVRIL